MSADGADPLIGRLVDGRYRVDERVARGGMATVYRATDTRLERTVALKVMRPSFAEDPDFVARFTREARAAARLANPHIVKVFDQGQDGRVIYLAMEYVPSQTLRDVLNTRGSLPVNEALGIIDPVLQALAAAHSESVVHRDVKPENVLVGTDGHVFVTDFGLARATGSSSTQHMTSGLLLGTVAYLSPEQVKPGVSDERSDVYAAGIVLFEMLTGSPPFTGTEAISVAYRHVNEDVPPPSEAVPDISTELDEAVLAATSRDPNQRPADAAALLQLIRAVPRALASPTVAPPAEAPIDLQQTMVVPVGAAVGAAGAAAAAASSTPTRHDTAVSVAPSPNGTVDGPVITSPPSPPGDVAPKPDEDNRALDPQRHRKRSRRRGFIALAIVLLLAIAAGAFAWWLGEGRYTTVPSVAGMSAQAAESRLEAEGLGVEYGNEQFSEIVKAGEVISSNPEQGAEIRTDGTVTLIVSKGPERYDVPKVIGEDLGDAKETIREGNLTVGEIKRKYSDTVEQGVVMKTNPKAGSSERPDTRVDLVVSKGLPPVTVPDLFGDSESSAQAQLDERNLEYDKVGEENSGKVAAGGVVSQTPSAGSSVEQGTTVEVVISLGPPLREVPDLFEMRLEDAIAELKAAGFRYETYEVLGVSPFNRVTEQDPGAGEMAPKGSVIRLGIF